MTQPRRPIRSAQLPEIAPPSRASQRAQSTALKEHIEYHKDGSVWARGQTARGVPAGYWEWFRLDGTKMRSGHFENGEQAGEWTTYDKKGHVYKVTQMKPKAKATKNA